MTDPLATYLTEVEGLSAMPWPERQRRLNEARQGDEEAKRSVIEAYLLDAARIALSCPDPPGASDLGKIQEANLVLIDCVEDASIPDLLAALKERIPRRLKSAPHRRPGSDEEEDGH